MKRLSTYLVSKVKLIANILLMREFWQTRDIVLQTERHGSDYGGWHLCPLDLSSNSVVYSFGIGKDVTFDLSLIEQYGLEVHGFDPTVESIDWVSKQQLPASFIFHAIGVANYDGQASFHPPANSAHISHSLVEDPQRNNSNVSTVLVNKLQTIIDTLGHSEIDVLKLDIEGAEFDVIPSMIKSNIRPKQVLVEFHHRLYGIKTKQTRDTIKLLQNAGYLLYYISTSNHEFSFIHSEQIKSD